MIRCTVGVMAYNEEDNIVQVLDALLNQELNLCQICEIVVVASGCTDCTVELAQQMAQAYPVIQVEVQRQRAGKASAINHLINMAQGEVIVLAGADTLPDPTALENLVKPFVDPTTGMTGARIIPLNDSRTLLGFTVQMLWHIHHRMAVRWPKLGELVAFRNVISEIPADSATDEVALEALIRQKEYRLVYAPEAIVYNRGPQTLGDFLNQRRRIFAGHLHIAKKYGYTAASMPFSHLVLLTGEIIEQYPGLLPKIILAVFLECLARMLGALDFLLKHKHHIWKRIGTTKEVQSTFQPLMLIIFRYCGGSLDPGQLVRDADHVPNSIGKLLWWDQEDNQAIFVLSDHLAAVSPEEQINRLTSYITLQDHPDGEQVLSYRLVRFKPFLSSDSLPSQQLTTLSRLTS
jgi:biofilm PGA synthesis N-glycosyltransferase PgaC